MTSLGPRHAPKARFDRWKHYMHGFLYGTGITVAEARAMAHTAQQVERWTETDFNWHMREALKAQKYAALHIREADQTGVADLIVYSMMQMPQVQIVDAWLELKMDNDPDKKNVRASQVEFMREHWRTGRNALFVCFDRKVGMLAVRQGDWKGRVKMLPPSPYATKWQEVFDHFKARRS